MDDLPPEILKILCDYAMDGLRIRQEQVPHLVMENVSPEMLERVIRAYREGLNPQLVVSAAMSKFLSDEEKL